MRCRSHHRATHCHNAVAAHQPNPVAIFHWPHIGVRVAHCLRYFTGCNRLGRTRHCLSVHCRISLRVVKHQRRQRLGHGARWHHAHIFLRQCIDLVSNRNDVLVVRQDHHLLRIHVFNGVQQLGCRRVHCLPTRHHTLHIHLPKQLGQPVATANCHHSTVHWRQLFHSRPSHRRCVLYTQLGFTLRVLFGNFFKQIRYANLEWLSTQLQRRLNCCTNVVGVHVAVV